MNEKDAQVLIKYLMRETEKTDVAKKELMVGMPMHQVVEIATAMGYVRGLMWAINLIEDAVGDSE